MTHPVELDKIADYMGELCGAARRDLDAADPRDVGLNGMPVKQWRAAYLEGCQDMANGIASKLPKECQETIKNIVTAAFERERGRIEPVDHSDAILAADLKLNGPSSANAS
jgi:hypothetical protein